MTHPEVATLYASIGPPQQVLLAERGNGDGGVKSISDLNSVGRERKQLNPFKGNERPEGRKEGVQTEGTALLIYIDTLRKISKF